MPALIDQIFMQAGGGPSANGQSLPLVDALAGGRQLREASANAAMERRVMEQTLQFNQDLHALQLAEAEFSMQTMKGLQAASTAAAGWVAQAVTEPEFLDDPANFAEAQQLLRTPGLATTDTGKTMLNILGSVRERQEAAQARQAAAASGLTPTRTTVSNAAGGTTTFEQPVSGLSREEARQMGLEVSGVGADGRLLYARPRVGEEFTITTPEGTTIRKGPPGAESVTRPTLTAAEEVVNTAQDFLSVGKELVALAEPENVGIRGAGQRLITSTLGQFVPIEAGEEETFASAVQFFRSKGARILRTDGQISEAERAQIIAALPSSGWLEAPSAVKQKALFAMRQIADSARRQILQAGLGLPPALLKPEEVKALFEQGQLSRDQATQLIRTSPFSLEVGEYE